MKNRLSAIGRVLISVSLIVILLYIMRDKYGEIFGRLKETNVALFSLALIAFSCAIAVASVRLKLIIESQDIRVTFREALSLSLIGYFFNNFLPTTIGGDVVKAYYLSKKGDENMSSYASVLVDRLIGLLTMIFMAFAAASIAGGRVSDPMIRTSIYAITLASLLAVLFMVNKSFARTFSFFLFFLKPLEKKLKKAYNVVHKYKNHKMLIYKSFLISIASQLLFFLSLAMLIFSIGSRVTLIDILVRIPLVSILSLLPSINGLGLREGSTVFLFGPLIGNGNAFAVSILWLAILFIISIIGGLVYAISPQFKMNLKEVE